MAGDAYLWVTNGGIAEKHAVQTSAGAADAGKIPALDSTGRLAVEMMPDTVMRDPTLPTGAIAQTFSRQGATGSSNVTATGRLHGFAVWLPANKPVTSISFLAVTAGGSLTNQWFALADNAGHVVAVTNDDTTTLWNITGTPKTLNLAGGAYTTTYAGLWYLCLMIAGTTMPTFFSSATVQLLSALLPASNGFFATGQTTPHSLPWTPGVPAPLGVAITPYGYCS